jgi:beta-1,4-mannosyl-glycoprotein beta-1,4-N-acetylglucosaminyltransferase
VKPNIIKQIRSREIVIDQVCHIEMKCYYYNLYYVAKTKWYHTFVSDYKSIQKYIDLSTLRLSDSNKFILNGGWHLSYFGDSQFIKNKLESFAHQEFNNKYYNNDYLIENSMKNGIQFWCNEKLNYVEIEANDDLPDRYKELLSKFA